MNQGVAMAAIRMHLNARTGRPWRTRAGLRTSYDKIYITSPPDRKWEELGTSMNADDRVTLAMIFKLPVDTITDMVVVPGDQYEKYVALAKGE